MASRREVECVLFDEHGAEIARASAVVEDGDEAAGFEAARAEALRLAAARGKKPTGLGGGNRWLTWWMGGLCALFAAGLANSGRWDLALLFAACALACAVLAARQALSSAGAKAAAKGDTTE